MEIGKKNQIILIAILIFYGLLANHPWSSSQSVERSQSGYSQRRETEHDQIQVGMILDMGSREGKIFSSCISTAISDFYGQHRNFSTRIVLHRRNSRGEPLRALSAALDLLDKTKVRAIIGGQTRMEAKYLAELGDKAGFPFISVSEPISYEFYKENSFLVQVTQDEVSQFRAMAATVEAFNWKDVSLIYEETDIGRDIIYLIDSFQEKNIKIKDKIAIAASFTEKRILDELHRFATLQTSTIFVVHLSGLGLVSQLLINSKKVGLMAEGYAWLLTATTTNFLPYVDVSVIQSMQGIIGLKYYIPASKGLHNLTSRLRREVYIENPDMEVLELGTSAIRAYDSTWALAKAAESSSVKLITPSSKVNDKISLDLLDLEKFRTSKNGTLLLNEILQSNFVGISGPFQFFNGKPLSKHMFEIVNFIGREDKHVGFLTHDAKENTSESKKGRRFLSLNTLEAIIWPGGSTIIPRGRSLAQRKLRIGVPVKVGFSKFVHVDHDSQSNSTYVTGFCIDVFKAAVNLLPYEIDYEFVPFQKANGEMAGTYNDLVFQVFLENYDAAVGDITILSNRSHYVDFTIPFSDVGIGLLIKAENTNMWIFLKPLSANLWITTGGFFLLIAFVVWVIENPTNEQFPGFGTALWFAFSTLVFAQKEKLLNNLAKFVVIVWLFVVLILTSSYTATLASMMTIRQIQLNGGVNYIGYQTGSFIGSDGQFDNLQFKESKPLRSIEEFAEALSKGSKHGGVSAIIDEIPYIKVFLAAYDSDKYSMVKSAAATNGFGFAFPKGSPMVQDMSNAIMKLRETGDLANFERAWLDRKLSLIPEDFSKDPSALTLESFRGLFIISGITCTMALFLFFVFSLREKLDAVKNYMYDTSRYLWQSCVTKWLSNRVPNRMNDDEQNL